MRRSEPHITRLMQYGLIAQGHSLPKFGADGDWGDETQRAYDAYTARFKAPEKPTIINAVVDLSHHNRVADFNAAKADGIVGVIHKATQGFRYTDPKYESRRSKALDAGLLWGAYHFAVGGDGAAQADYFLKFVEPKENDLVVLDLENNPSGSSMTIDEAEEFVEYIHSSLRRWPGLYSGHYIKEKLGNNTDTILSNCWLWIAQYGERARVPSAWSTWTMWQYTDGAIGPEPHVVDGIGHCDRDMFNGNLDALKNLWISSEW
jgi:lysozyme